MLGICAWYTLLLSMVTQVGVALRPGAQSVYVCVVCNARYLGSVSVTFNG